MWKQTNSSAAANTGTQGAWSSDKINTKNKELHKKKESPLRKRLLELNRKMKKLLQDIIEEWVWCNAQLKLLYLKEIKLNGSGRVGLLNLKETTMHFRAWVGLLYLKETVDQKGKKL